MPRRIHTWHLGSFTTNQCHARLLTACGNPLDHRPGQLRIQLIRRKIIQEEQRLCPIRQQVVGHHCDEVNANRIVLLARLR